MLRQIFEWIDGRGEGVISGWELQVEQHAKLEEKAALLRTAEVDLRTGKVQIPPSLLAQMGPIYKMRIRTRSVELRPRLALGPIDRAREWTFVARATERGNKTIPPNADELARSRCEEILADPTRRRLLWEEDDPTS